MTGYDRWLRAAAKDGWRERPWWRRAWAWVKTDLADACAEAILSGGYSWRLR
jgi:hypothetical protein